MPLLWTTYVAWCGCALKTGTWRVDEPTQVKVQVHSAGKGPSEWNRHVMNAAKKSPYGNQGGFAPPASLAGILPGMPQLGMPPLACMLQLPMPWPATTTIAVVTVHESGDT